MITFQRPSNATVYTWFKDTGGDNIPPGTFEIVFPTGTINENTPTVTWLFAEGADFYDMAIGTDALCSTPVQSFPNLTTTSVILTTPLADGAYSTCVEARDLAGNTTAASNNGLSFTVDAIDDEAPGPLTITGPTGAINVDRPTLTWDISAGADFYDLTITADASCNIVIQSLANLTATSATLTTALSDGGYFSCVTARDEAGNTTIASNNGLGFTIDAVDDVPPGAFAITASTGAWNPGLTCQAWNSTSNSDNATVGNASVNGSGWFEYKVQDCTQQARLYCASPLIAQ